MTIGALESFGETCLATADLIQKLLDSAELGEDANNALSQHHVVLTRQGWNLADKKTN